tara:strand:- start:47 stop:685 length:639 start_codon:yes stop_codon:yes gene_type:complete
MNNTTISSLFSIPLMESDYGQTSEDENNIIYHHLNDVRHNLYNVSTKETYLLHKEKGLSKLKKFIESSIDMYVKNIVVGDEYNRDELNFKITQSWANLIRPDSLGHHPHTHTNSIISGVFYVKTNDVDNITFTNNFLHFFETINIEAIKFNQYNSTTWKYPVSSGKLILFPSNVCHQVEAPIGKGDRISLSFNVFPFGTIGKRDELTELRIQ